MLALVIAGLILGALTGGVALNILLSEPLADLNAWSFTGACVVGFVVLGLVQGGAARRR